MNYFAHGYQYTRDPYFLAGTAVPDWLSIVDRQVRVRARRTQALIDDPDPRVAAVARGIQQHLSDDDWFHQTTAFHQLNVAFTGRIRSILSGDDGYRPAFLGHILLELLLDAELIARQPATLDSYYSALAEVDSTVVEAAVNRISVQTTDRLVPLLPRFLSERFLYDYLDDGKLLHRLNQVMHRVKLPVLPESLRGFLPEARQAVRERTDELLRL